jgi:hypothetical protein
LGFGASRLTPTYELRQVQRLRNKPDAGFIRTAYSIPASNVASLSAFRDQLDAEARVAHLPNLKQFKTDPSRFYG